VARPSSQPSPARVPSRVALDSSCSRTGGTLRRYAGPHVVSLELLAGLRSWIFLVASTHVDVSDFTSLLSSRPRTCCRTRILEEALCASRTGPSSFYMSRLILPGRLRLPGAHIVCFSFGNPGNTNQLEKARGHLLPPLDASHSGAPIRSGPPTFPVAAGGV
jgi:hypothetical protein